MSKLIAAAFMLILLPSCAYAASDWVEVARTKNSISYIDKNSIDKRGNTLLYWLKYLHKDNYQVEGQKVWYTMLRSAESCSENQNMIMEIALYNTSGKLIHYAASPDMTPVWRSVIPETIGELYHQFLCGTGKIEAPSAPSP